MLQHNIGQFSHQGLLVCPALTRNDSTVVRLQIIVEVDETKYQFSTRLHFTIKVLHQSISQPACCSCPRLLRLVEAEVVGRHRGKRQGFTLQYPHIIRAGSFLWGKHGCGSLWPGEWIGHIRGKRNPQVELFQIGFHVLPSLEPWVEDAPSPQKGFFESSQHSQSTVACGGAAQADSEFAHSFIYSVHHHFANAV